MEREASVDHVDLKQDAADQGLGRVSADQAGHAAQHDEEGEERDDHLEAARGPQHLLGRLSPLLPHGLLDGGVLLRHQDFRQHVAAEVEEDSKREAHDHREEPHDRDDSRDHRERANAHYHPATSEATMN